MEYAAAKIAESLLEIKAVKLQPQNPFTWASGWRSPVYCDNRVTLSFPEVRNLIRDTLVQAVQIHFPETEGIAGVATAGIPQGALLADALQLPFIYVRSKAKSHGMTNQIEGQLEAGKKYLVLEDLVSPGGSSLKAVEAIRAVGGEVNGLLSVFTYNFPVAHHAFRDANVGHRALVDLELLLGKAVENDYISPFELETISQWRQDPQAWTDAFKSES